MKRLAENALPTRRSRTGVLAVLVLIAMLAPAGSVSAATFDIGCGVDVLISAIHAANATDVADIIVLAPGCTYTLTAVDNETDCPNGLPSIVSPISIHGNGATIVRSPAAPDFRLFHVDASGILILKDLTLAGGVQDCADFGFNVGGAIVNFGALTMQDCIVRDHSAGMGGGIANAGDAALVYCTISNNSAGSGGGIDNHKWGTLRLTHSTVRDSAASDGGGIYNDGTATLVDSTISGNAGSLWGGGVVNEGTATLTGCVLRNNTSEFGGGFINAGELILSRCAVHGNSAVESDGASAGIGAGIYNYGSAEITDSTISENSATNEAGGIYNDDGLTLANATIVNNIAGKRGGGVYADTFGAVELKNTLVAGNVATTGPDCAGELDSHGYNLIGNNDGCVLTPTTGDQVGTPANPIDPLLGPF